MTIPGTFKNGVVVLDEPQQLEEGTRVQVVVAAEASRPSIKGLLEFAGAASDLPAHMADQHDHYLHGAPKR